MHNYPNPFNPVTVIKYNLESANNVILNIYNAKGDLVKNLVSRNQPAGNYSVSFDASGINSGVYFYKLALDGKSVVRKMLLIK